MFATQHEYQARQDYPMYHFEYINWSSVGYETPDKNSDEHKLRKTKQKSNPVIIPFSEDGTLWFLSRLLSYKNGFEVNINLNNYEQYSVFDIDNIVNDLYEDSLNILMNPSFHCAHNLNVYLDSIKKDKDGVTQSSVAEVKVIGSKIRKSEYGQIGNSWLSADFYAKKEWRSMNHDRSNMFGEDSLLSKESFWLCHKEEKHSKYNYEFIGIDLKAKHSSARYWRNSERRRIENSLKKHCSSSSFVHSVPIYDYDVKNANCIIFTPKDYQRVITKLNTKLDRFPLFFRFQSIDFCKNKSSQLCKCDGECINKPKEKLIIKNTEEAVFKETQVYLMVDKNTNYYKIGRSKNPLQREKTLQSEKPTIELLFYKAADLSCEKTLHNKFASNRIRGEWFNLDNKDIEYIKNYLS